MKKEINTHLNQVKSHGSEIEVSSSAITQASSVQNHIEGTHLSCPHCNKTINLEEVVIEKENEVFDIAKLRKIELEKMSFIDRQFANTSNFAVVFTSFFAWPLALLIGLFGWIFCKNKEAKNVGKKFVGFTMLFLFLGLLVFAFSK
jgi:hypothetical protein